MTNETFDAVNCPMDGISLVEAAAGTGKTYNIQSLFLRALLELPAPDGSAQGIGIENILLLTFTKAAAAELEQRISSVLHDALFHPGSREKALLEHAEKNGVSRQEIKCRLRRALDQFDRNMISTIHSFCQKMLTAYAFESGVRFHFELQGSSKELIHSLCTDFYRSVFCGNGGWKAQLLDGKINREDSIKIVEKKFAHPKMEIIPENPDSDQETFLLRFLSDTDKLDFSPAESLRGRLNAPYSDKFIDEQLRAIREGKDLRNKADAICAFSADVLRQRITRRSAANAAATAEILKAPVFRDCEKFAEARQQLIDRYYTDCIAFVMKKSTGLKSEENFLTFDDLLLRMAEAVKAEDGRMRNALRKRFSIGIVDEFQDTDPIQYEIFRQIFQYPGGCCFLVGDPRQAIYSFRGGDIFTYRQAAQDAARKYVLCRNFRSSKPMIDAVNVLFHDQEDAFLDPDISLPEVLPRNDGEDISGIRFQGKENPFPIRIVQGSGEEATAKEVAALLNDDQCRLPDGRRPRPEDIAILVASGYCVPKLIAALQKYHLNASFVNLGNVFESEAAAGLLRFLQAVLEYQDSEKIAAGLQSLICNKSAEELVKIAESPEEQNAQHENFRKLLQTWQDTSFMAMLADAANQFHTFAALSSQLSGERHIADLTQLSDILQQRAGQFRLSPAAVVADLTHLIAAPDSLDEDISCQYLASDRPSIKIVTIHKSKGLEYPIAVLPDLGDMNYNKHYGEYHLPDGKLVFDLQESPESQKFSASERQRENLRLAYVALTRAKYYTILLTGKSKTSPLHTLLANRDERVVPQNPVESQSPYQPPDTADDSQMHWEEFKGSIGDHWKITSFSGLTPGGSADALPEKDAGDDSREKPGDSTSSAPSESGFFRLPAGNVTGNAWHKILEEIDFTTFLQDAQKKQKIRKTLDLYFLSADEKTAALYREETLRVIEECLQTPLCDGENTFFLQQIDRRHRASEMEFYFRFKGTVSLKRIAAVLGEYAAKRFHFTDWPAGSRYFSGGFITGFIDLLLEHNGKYYVLDWKSNSLKNNIDNFAPDALTAVMREEFYFLQYLFYCTALLKILRRNFHVGNAAEFAEHFGGVFYLFLRGVSASHPGRGVFFEKPDYELLTRLEALFDDGK